MGQSESQEYNNLGQLWKKTDFKGQVTELTYDNFGRVQAQNFNNEQTVEVIYDSLGRQSQISDSRGTTTFAYDNESRLTKVENPEGEINYEYNQITGRKTRTWTLNSDVRFSYDVLGRLQKVSVYKRNGVALTTPEETVYSYTAVGSRENVTLPNGVTTQYEYDTLNRLKTIAHYNSNDALLAGYEYTLAPNGRRTGVHEERLEADSNYSTTDIAYAYDKLNRLVSESSTSSLQSLNFTNVYTYDLVGNRLEKRSEGVSPGVVSYSYNENDQLLTENSSVNGQTSYSYDPNGSLLSKNGSDFAYNYTYNAQNRLSAAGINRLENGHVVQVSANYAYNQAGIRVRANSTETVDGIASQNNRIFLLDSGLTGYQQVFEELNQIGGTPVASYTIADDVISQSIVLGVRHFCMDGHGSNRLLTDANAAVTDRYDSYGMQVAQAPNVTSPSATNLLYSGEQFDFELPQQYLRARYYDQNIGRFPSLDPFVGNNSDPQSLHKYNYCYSDPV